jgi:molybdopterin-guanine dinucleotide biosynthesis protein A
MKPPGVILAGGRATRMGGGDKGLVTIGGRPLLAHVIDRLRPQVSGILLNANGDADRFRDFDLPVRPDPIAGFPGPLAGILAGLDWAAEEGAEAVVSVPVDTPFFPEDLVARLLHAARGRNRPLAMAATPRRDGARLRSGGTGPVNRHPTFGLWSTGLRDDLRAALADGVRKVVLWTDRHDPGEALFEDTPFDPFFNVNTPEDVAEAERMLGT